MQKPTGLNTAIEDVGKEDILSIVEELTKGVTLIRVKPGDALAIKIPEYANDNAVRSATLVLESQLPGGVRFFFYSGGSMEYELATAEQLKKVPSKLIREAGE